ncbi:restriction endonuclease subunit S [Brachybacterium tyrofermentans]|uniref:restriction endonuclease subunit S n=1 Tax=Brachybacterium tyrofermentans TaxID=47848 RepID=UPI00186887AD|nr:restriction endonuclease subunit S [Brachybacterium tyrofermentans]
MNWPIKRVKNVAELAIGPFGSALKADTYVSEGLPVVAGGNLGGGRWPNVNEAPRVSSETASRLLRSVAMPGDLIFPHRGSIGRVGIADRDLMLSTSMMRARFDPKIVDSEFAYWFFLAQGSRELLTMASSVGTPGIGQPLASLGSVGIKLPPMSVQKALAAVLGALEDKVDANRCIANAVDDLIRAQVAPRLAESSQLWDALKIVFGEAFKGDSFSVPGIGRALVRIRDLKSQKCQVWTTERRPKEFEVRPGALLVGMDAEFRATRWSGPIGVLNQRVLAASSVKYGPAISREMLVAPLRRVERSKSGTTVIHLNKSDLLAESVLAPVDSDVPALRALVDPMWDRAVAAEQESVRVAATRDELLPLLMAGKITVKDAEKTVEEVV